jgi:hypothetical protein
MFMQLARVLVVSIVAVQMSVIQAQASLILNFQFSGNQTSGSIVFNDGVADSNPDPKSGLYHNAIVNYVINIDGTPSTGGGTAVFETLHGASGDIVVGVESGIVGGCGFSTDCIAFILGAPFLGQGPTDFDLTFDYPAGSFLSDALPVAVPPTGQGILRSDVEQFFLGVNASTRVTPVPEPSPLVQLLFGLAVITLLRHVFISRHKAKRL